MQRFSWITAFLLVFFLQACKEEKKPLLDTEQVEVGDFIEFFSEVKLPFQLADTSLLRRSPDSLRIGNKIFAQFVPDSVLSAYFGKKGKPQLHPLGRVDVENGQTYLSLKATQGTKRASYLLVFNEEKYVTAMPLIQLQGKPAAGSSSVATMDSKYTITTLRQRNPGDGQLVYTKKVYVYNTEGVFTMILTESNDKNASTNQLLNPIDTLPATQKLAGDYLQNKNNLVSVRDGKTAGTLMFFIHFEKDGGACRGELKGEARMTGTNTARYTEGDGPCVIDFNFSGNTVRIKEVEGCGSYRDIKCFFEGSYTRKKKASAASKKKK